MSDYTEITEGSKAIMRDMKQNSSVDKCSGCTLRGDIKACEAVECSNHDNWYPQQLKDENERLKEALEFIVKWDIPKVRDREGRLQSYSVMHGSNGERDFMRKIASKASVGGV